jgi:DNA polymerase-3 subunit delta
METHSPEMIYLLLGEETFLLQEALDLLKHRSLEAATREFNCDVFDASDTSAELVRDAAEMLPMMSPRRLVIYRGVDNLKEKDWEALLPLLERPVESTTLILTAEALDKRKKAFKKLSETAVVVELKRPYDSQIADWIEYLAFRRGMTVTREASLMLKQYVGVNLTELNNELGKLQDYLGERKQVEAEDVLKIVSQTRVDRIFDFTDAIGRRDPVTALHSLANLLDHGQSEVGILAMLTRHFRILAQLKDGQKAGLYGTKLSTKAGIPQFLLNQYLQQIAHWNESKIEQTFGVLEDTDRALKSSSVPPHVWLENFVLKTCT